MQEKISSRIKFIKNLEKQYTDKFYRSHKIFIDGSNYFPNHASHSARLFKPFPPFIKSAYGSTIKTVENIELVDFWQGHFTNILGHNNKIITDAARAAFDERLALQSGLLTPLENKLAAILKKTTKLESFIFTTSGTLATMYGIMMGLAKTKRSKVLKLEGGWHGAQPWSMVGVKYPKGLDRKISESSGLSNNWSRIIMTTPINDIYALRKIFKKFGNQMGVFIIELVLGNSGMIVANKEFIKEARSLTEKYGVVFMIDEMVTGFRVHAGGFFELYGIRPDLVTFGKIITGGMPFSCIAGNKDILAEASISKQPRIWGDSGTFSCHPLALATAIAMVSYLSENEKRLYPSIINNMNMLRSRCRAIMSTNGIEVDITGESNDSSIPNFPIGTIRFIKNKNKYKRNRAISHWDHDSLDIDMRDRISKLALMLKGFYTWQGLGVVTAAHSKKDINRLISAYDYVATDFKKYLV